LGYQSQRGKTQWVHEDEWSKKKAKGGERSERLFMFVGTSFPVNKRSSREDLLSNYDDDLYLYLYIRVD
jgi:hypothetical protein